MVLAAPLSSAPPDKRLVRTAALTVGLMSLIHLLAGTQHAGAQAPSISDTGRAAIDDYLDEVVRDTYIPGIVALVTNRDGVFYSRAFGSRNVAQGVPMTVDSIGNYIFISKNFFVRQNDAFGFKLSLLNQQTAGLP